jgi:hypothetical protein
MEKQVPWLLVTLSNIVDQTHHGVCIVPNTHPQAEQVLVEVVNPIPRLGTQLTQRQEDATATYHRLAVLLILRNKPYYQGNRTRLAAGIP